MGKMFVEKLFVLAERGLHLIEDDCVKYCVFGTADDHRSFINHNVHKRVTKHSA